MHVVSINLTDFLTNQVPKLSVMLMLVVWRNKTLTHEFLVHPRYSQKYGCIFQRNIVPFTNMTSFTDMTLT